MNNGGRQYRMEARAAAAARTGERILDAMLERFARLPYDQIRLEDVAAEAFRHGLALENVVEMPANNLSVVFRRS